MLITSLTASAIGPDVVGTLDSDRQCNKGDVFIVIDPSTQPQTAQGITAYLDAIRASGHPERPVAGPRRSGLVFAPPAHRRRLDACGRCMASHPGASRHFPYHLLIRALP
ncbi:hypothetical protein LP417_33310 (plasmid) [Polaromonas sp. P1-6]|nr:hypothetical protein LP417_33310 [Polaromonas sp. P1-6]